MVSPAKQIWHCFGCGLGGSIFDFIMQMENVDFAQALKILANRAGIELKKLTPAQVAVTDKKELLYEINMQAADYFARVLWDSQTSKPALDYLRNRGLADQTIKNWQLGFAPDDFHYLENHLSKKYSKQDIVAAGLIIKKDQELSVTDNRLQITDQYFDRFRGRIMFPILNIHGRVVGFTGRLLKELPNAGKYVNSPETDVYNKSREVYGLFAAKNSIRKLNQVILVEGNMDVIAAHQAGFDNTVASSGTAFTEDQLLILKRFSESLVFAFDADVAGSTATRRALETALNLDFDVKIVDLGDAKDPDELIKKGIGLWKKAVSTARNFVEFYFEKTFSQYNVNDIEDKRKISKELIPLIARMNDPISRAHFVHKLALGISVAESIVWDIINKTKLPKLLRSELKVANKKSKLEMLEERLLGLSLNLKDRSVLAQFRQADFTSDNGALFELLINNPELSSEQLIHNHPNSAEKIEMLSFAASVNPTTELKPSDEVLGLAKELAKNLIKARMEVIAQALTQAEKNKDDALIRKLSQEYTELSHKLK